MDNLSWILPVGVLVVAFIIQLFLAPYRIYKEQEVEAERLNSELSRFTTPQLQVELLPLWENPSLSRESFVIVDVRNTTKRTILNVSAHIESISYAGEAPSEKTTNQFSAFYGLPLIINGKYSPTPPYTCDLHPGANVRFNVVSLRKKPPEIHIQHASGRIKWDSVRGDLWYPNPEQKLFLGFYTIRIRIQGQDAPSEALSVKFKNERDTPPEVTLIPNSELSI